jgi:hypothetical protein
MRAIGNTLIWAKTHERQISALSLAGGFAFDSFTFGRIDHFVTQAVFIVYLLVAGIAIAVLHGLESRPEERRPTTKVRTVLLAVIQFALGCLLSGFCVFYIRSASLISSWPFLLFMAAIFIGNEYLRRYHSRLVFVALLFFFSLYSYAIMLVPVVTGHIGRIPFLVSGAVALVIFIVYMRALARLGHERYKTARWRVAAGMAVITALINAFYFLKVFPPLPLVLTDAGIYHDVMLKGAVFEVVTEDQPPPWRALFGTYPVLHIQHGAKIAVYSAVFAPQRLETRIRHVWQWRNPSGGWVTQQSLPITIRGGREDGFRAYTRKSAPLSGQWRVNIESDDGRAIGRVRFSVEQQAVPPAMSVKTLK